MIVIQNILCLYSYAREAPHSLPPLPSFNQKGSGQQRKRFDIT